MDNSLLSRIFAKISIAIIALALVDLLFLNWWVVRNENLKLKIENLEKKENSVALATPPVTTVQITPSPTTSTTTSDKTASSPLVETKTVETRTVVEKETQTIVQTAQKEIFIPIGSGSTFSNNYVDLPGLQVNIDTTKYSPLDSVVFEASIWVQDGNGKVYARLYTKDEGAVLGSEMTTTSATSTPKTSGKFILPSGSKVYTVQAKTDLTAYAAHVENARVKITLK